MKALAISADERSDQSPQYFFTGIPCHHGHITVRYTNGHACAQCSQDRALARQRSGKTRQYVQEYRQRDYVKAKESARYRLYRQTRLDRLRDNILKHKFGMAVGEYDRMLALQNGICAICGRQPKRRRLAVDHCHETGKIRGLLCEGCNTALGGAKDDPEVLYNAIRYLWRHQKEGPNAKGN